MNHRQQQARDRAVALLQHYVRILFMKAGASASYTSDTDVELAQIVDDIISAATPATPEETQHVQQLAKEKDPR